MKWVLKTMESSSDNYYRKKYIGYKTFSTQNKYTHTTESIVFPHGNSQTLVSSLKIKVHGVDKVS